ncbi:adenylyl-sulfate kinase [Krasilnikovia sp. MM14-A1259]|uniref:adenylyl-sulfate kinase n=1 Tax=Krasilnikovia sp. MM14-A1259 TaxID=3373539 RepID=UPI00380D4C99
MRHGAVVWLTGLSGAGKTTVAGHLVEMVLARGTRPVLLDGDRIRAALPTTLGHTAAERRQLGAGYGRLAREFARQGHLVVCATISLFHDIQRWNRANLPHYVEVWLRVPEAELRRRDPKGLYGAGHADLAGVDVPAQFPTSPDLVIDNSGATSAEQAAAAVLHALIDKDLT